MTTEKHPITQLEEITKTLKSRRFGNLDLDQVMIAVHLLNNLLVRIDIEKTPAIKAAAADMQFYLGQTVEQRVNSSGLGGQWQRVTIIVVNTAENGTKEYATTHGGRSVFVTADDLRIPVQ